MKGKKTSLSYTIKKEKIKQIDEIEENTINCLVICNLKEMECCTSVKFHVWTWTKSFNCIFFHELPGVFIYIHLESLKEEINFQVE